MMAFFITLGIIIMLCGCALIIYSAGNDTWKGTALGIIAIVLMIVGFVLVFNAPKLGQVTAQKVEKTAAATSYYVDTVYNVKNGANQDTTYIIHWKGK